MLRKTLALALLCSAALAGCHRTAAASPEPTANTLPTNLTALPPSTTPTSSEEPETSLAPTTVEPVILPCSFRPTPVDPAVRPVVPPPNGNAPTDPETVAAVIKTGQGPVPVSLDPTKAPCAVRNFLSLAQQHFYDNTACHRLTTDGIFVLQCGDPTGTGSGGPGYSFPDEYPIGTRALPAPDAESTLYTRGVLAMANSGPDTNGSQFFLVYKNSPLPPHYTIFGHIDEPGLKVLDQIAAGGIVPSPNSDTDGKPTLAPQILSVQLP